jgi:hypothetical protein
MAFQAANAVGDYGAAAPFYTVVAQTKTPIPQRVNTPDADKRRTPIHADLCLDTSDASMCVTGRLSKS